MNNGYKNFRDHDIQVSKVYLDITIKSLNKDINRLAFKNLFKPGELGPAEEELQTKNNELLMETMNKKVLYAHILDTILFLEEKIKKLDFKNVELIKAYRDLKNIQNNN